MESSIIYIFLFTLLIFTPLVFIYINFKCIFVQDTGYKFTFLKCILNILRATIGKYVENIQNLEIKQKRKYLSL